MARGRVVVSDLPAPERIQPAPIQSDTYARPAQPPINNDLENLSKALGVFGAGLSARLKSEEKDNQKAALELATAEMEHWKATRTSTQQLDEIRAGRAPWFSDPYVGKVFRQHYAALEAEDVAREIDNDIASQAVPLGTNGFSAEQYVLDKARSRADKMSVDADMMLTFRRSLDQIRGGVTQRHQAALGASFQAASEDAARRLIEDGLMEGLRNGLEGQALMDALRPIYKELGPRMKGGSLDLKYGELDKVLVDVIEHHAKNPEYAAKVARLLYAQRYAGDDPKNPFRLGSLSEVAKNSDRVSSIMALSVKTLGDAAEKGMKAKAEEYAHGLLKRNDGSFSTIQDIDIENPEDPNRRIKVSREQLQEAATRRFVQETERDPERQLDVIIKNGIKHPTIVPFLDNAVTGFLNTNSSGGTGGPEQFSKIIEAGEMYQKIAGKNFAYTSHLSKQSREFFEGYTALRNELGMTPEEAAASIAREHSSKTAEQREALRGDRLGQLRDAAKGFGSSWLKWRSAAVNGGEVEKRMEDLAETVMKVTGLPADKAIQFAKKRMDESTMFLNGRAVFGVPGVSPDDAPHFQTIIGAYYKRNEAWLKQQGITAPNQISVAPIGTNSFAVIRSDNGFPMVEPVRTGNDAKAKPTEAPDGSISMSTILRAPPAIISGDALQRIRAATKGYKDQQALDKIINHRSLTDNPPSTAPLTERKKMKLQ